jgi:glucose/arabinose dehydrogenase
MQTTQTKRLVVITFILCTFGFGCNGSSSSDPSVSIPNSPAQPAAGEVACQYEQGGWGPTGTVALHVDKVVTGLNVPWGLTFLSNGDWLLTERPGQIRLVQNGQLVSNPVASVSIGEPGEGGLLGIALDPAIAQNGYFYVFYTTPENGSNFNRIQRFILSSDHKSATADKVLLDGIPAGPFHNGGRIKFGPDGKLYVGTGDSENGPLAQDPTSLNGKILRINSDGSIPSDNPFPNSAVFALGIRNLEAFDWVNPLTLIIADNGPTGDQNLTGLDKVAFASSGNNLGWPAIWGCQQKADLVTPILSFDETHSAPPGGGVVYHGSAIPEFDGNFIIGMMGMGPGTALQLHRVIFDAATHSLIAHEVYLQNQYGRLRDVVQGPDGALYVTTTNCDSRGSCPSDGDYILRITHG